MSKELDMATKLEEAGREYNTNTAERAVHEALDALKNRNQAEDMKILLDKLTKTNTLGIPKVEITEDAEPQEAPAKSAGKKG